jgi:hypothetical protein
MAVDGLDKQPKFAELLNSKLDDGFVVEIEYEYLR